MYGFILAFVVFCICLVIFIKIYAKWTCGRYKINQDLSGKVVVITGASAGIGKCVSLELAKHGATVHMVCRDPTKAAKVAQFIKNETGNAQVHVWQCDLSILQCVRDFCDKYLQAGHPIHLLINNAGIACKLRREVTVDGLEVTMATNHFGHFLMTNLLLDRIKETVPSRIVVLSSIVHRLWAFDIDDVNVEKNYNGLKSYCISKFANILFTRYLSKELEGTGVTVNCLHPGAVHTDLSRELPSLIQPILEIPFFFFKTPEEGAESVLYVALSEDLENVSGQYFWDNNFASVSPQALDMHLAKRFWEISTQLTQL